MPDPKKRMPCMHGIPSFRRTFALHVPISDVRLIFIPSAAKELFSTPLEQPFHRHPK